MIRLLLFPGPVGSLEGAITEALASLPLDTPDIEAYGDDAYHLREDPADPKPLKRIPLAAKPGPRWAPFTRPLKEGKQGEDVIAVQRALRRAGFRRIGPTGHYRRGTVRNVAAFQKHHGISATGRYGRPTHRKLLPFFDGYGSWLLQDWLHQQKPSKERLRHRIASIALFGVAMRAEIHYSQGPRRMEWLRKKLRPPHFPTELDCSAYVDWVYWVAGLADPAGQDYRIGGTVFTGTLAENGKRISRPLVGDLGLHGPPAPFRHVDIYVGAGRRVSHGNESGPELVANNYWNPVENRRYL